MKTETITIDISDSTMSKLIAMAEEDGTSVEDFANKIICCQVIKTDSENVLESVKKRLCEIRGVSMEDLLIFGIAFKQFYEKASLEEAYKEFKSG